MEARKPTIIDSLFFLFPEAPIYVYIYMYDITGTNRVPPIRVRVGTGLFCHPTGARCRGAVGAGANGGRPGGAGAGKTYLGGSQLSGSLAF